MAVALIVAARVACAQETHPPAHAADEAGKENPNPLVFDPDLAIFTAVVFLILLFVLGRWAWPQISAGARRARAQDRRQHCRGRGQA